MPPKGTLFVDVYISEGLVTTAVREAPSRIPWLTCFPASKQVNSRSKPLPSPTANPIPDALDYAQLVGWHRIVSQTPTRVCRLSIYGPWSCGAVTRKRAPAQSLFIPISSSSPLLALPSSLPTAFFSPPPQISVCLHITHSAPGSAFSCSLDAAKGPDEGEKEENSDFRRFI